MNLASVSIIVSISTLMLTITGWYVIHLFSKKRDSENKKKEIITTYLINAFRQIDDATNRKDSIKLLNLESAIADIQLFGSVNQIKMAQKIADDVKNNGTAECLELLNELRKDLRQELGLEKADGQWRSLRIVLPKSPQNQQNHL